MKCLRCQNDSPVNHRSCSNCGAQLFPASEGDIVEVPREGASDDDQLSGGETAGHSAPQTRQGYWLGWLFAYWVAATSLSALPTATGEELMALDLGGVALGVIAAAAAAVRSPIAWYIVLFFTGLQSIRPVALYTWALAHRESLGIDTPGPFLYVTAVAAGTFAVNLLYFGYFYRRRVMFGAARRWRMLERLIPRVVGPGILLRATSPRVGAFGLSFRATVFVALALTALLLVIY